MLRTHARIIQPRGNGVHRGDLSVSILAEIGLHAVEDTDPSRIDRCRCLKGVDALSCCLTSDQPYSSSSMK